MSTIILSIFKSVIKPSENRNAAVVGDATASATTNNINSTTHSNSEKNEAAALPDPQELFAETPCASIPTLQPLKNTTTSFSNNVETNEPSKERAIEAMTHQPDFVGPPPVPPPRNFPPPLRNPHPHHHHHHHHHHHGNHHNTRGSSTFVGAWPDHVLPTHLQMMLDQLEYFMHVILLEPNPVRAAFYSRQLKAVHGSLAAVLPAGILAGFLGSAGRLRSRMLLTGVALDVLLLKVEGDSTAVPTDAAASDADADTGTDAVTYASDLLFDDWKKIEDQLSKVKTVMLHKNANAPVDCNTLNQYQGEGETTELSSTQVAAPGGIGEEAIDLPLLDQHTMTTVDYTEVQQLLAVQMELARLKEGLQEIVEEVDGSDVADSPKSDEIKCKKSINKAVEKATNIFMKNLSKIYPPDVSDEGGNEAGDDEDYFQDAIDRAEDDCENETDSIRSMSRHKPRLSESNILSNIPKELHSLALTELYSPKKHPHTALGMVNQILIHLASITSDAPTPAMTQPGLFSHANLQNKMRALLTKWSESLLDIPTLIRLGYGGVPSPIVEKEEDDVSSWGGESDLEETDRRTNLSRSRSFTRILNATMRGRSGVALTDEEIDIIQKLSAVGVQRPFERSRSNSMDNTHLTNESGMLRQLGKRSGKTVQKAPRADAIAPLQSNILLASGLQAEPDKPVQLTEESKQIPDETDNDFDLDPSQEEFSELPSSVVAAPDSTLAIARTSRNRDRAQRGVFNKGHRFVASLAQSKTSFHDGLDDDDPIVADASDNSSKKVIRKPVKLSRLGTVIIRPTKKIRLSTPTVHQDTKENSLPRSSTDVGITPNRLVWAEKDDGKIDQTQTHPSIFNSTAYSKNKHHYFTTEETDAVRLGVALFGVGCWKDIQESDSRLKHRTTVQIKDKYRTMVNRGEL